MFQVGHWWCGRHLCHRGGGRWGRCGGVRAAMGPCSDDQAVPMTPDVQSIARIGGRGEREWRGGHPTGRCTRRLCTQFYKGPDAHQGVANKLLGPTQQRPGPMVVIIEDVTDLPEASPAEGEPPEAQAAAEEEQPAPTTCADGEEWVQVERGDAEGEGAPGSSSPEADDVDPEEFAVSGAVGGHRRGANSPGGPPRAVLRCLPLTQPPTWPPPHPPRRRPSRRPKL